MNIDEQSHRDEPLSRLLREWRSEEALPPRFQEGVWRRIERAETPAGAWPGIFSWIGTMLPRPALAAAYLAVLLALGATAGWTAGRQESTRVKGQLSELYVRSLNPYAGSQ